MLTLIRYVRSRHFSKSHGFGPAWFKWLWLDALAYGLARYATLMWPGFRLYCWRIDRLFQEQHDWAGSYTTDTGLDAWIDYYWRRETPGDAVSSEVSCWEP